MKFEACFFTYNPMYPGQYGMRINSWKKFKTKDEARAHAKKIGSEIEYIKAI